MKDEVNLLDMNKKVILMKITEESAKKLLNDIFSSTCEKSFTLDQLKGIEAAIDSLSEDLRDVLKLKYICGFTYEEIMDVLKLKNKESVATLLNKARRSLKVVGSRSAGFLKYGFEGYLSRLESFEHNISNTISEVNQVESYRKGYESGYTKGYIHGYESVYTVAVKASDEELRNEAEKQAKRSVRYLDTQFITDDKLEESSDDKEISVYDLGLDLSLARCLDKNIKGRLKDGLVCLKDIAELDYSEIVKIHGLGPKSIVKVYDKLCSLGIKPEAWERASTKTTKDIKRTEENISKRVLTQ